MQYRVTKLFTAGLLKGLTYVERQSWARPVGNKVYHGIGGDSYIIVECIESPEPKVSGTLLV